MEIVEAMNMRTDFANRIRKLRKLVENKIIQMLKKQSIIQLRI